MKFLGKTILPGRTRIKVWFFHIDIRKIYVFIEWIERLQAKKDRKHRLEVGSSKHGLNINSSKEEKN